MRKALLITAVMLTAPLTVASSQAHRQQPETTAVRRDTLAQQRPMQSMMTQIMQMMMGPA